MEGRTRRPWEHEGQRIPYLLHWWYNRPLGWPLVRRWGHRCPMHRPMYNGVRLTPRSEWP